MSLIPLESHVWKITGASPLMQSNPACMESPQSDELAKKKVYKDEEEAEMRCYRDGKLLCHPTSSFRKGMITAVTGMKFGKVTARSVIGAAVFPAEDFATLNNGNGKPFTDYEIDRRTVVIQKKRILRCRPKFLNWTMNLALDIDTDRITTDQVTQALNLMGRNIGIGEFRPDPSGGKSGVGTYGRFVAELVS